MCGKKPNGTLFLLFELLTGAGKFSLFEHVSRDLNRHSKAASWLILANLRHYKYIKKVTAIIFAMPLRRHEC